MKDMLYQGVLFLHSWLRWGVVILGLITAARAVRGWAGGLEWTRTDQRVRLLFITLLDSQVLLGLTLYFVLSPLTPRSLEGLRSVVSISVLRFFGLEHAVTMLTALVIAHAASVVSRKARDSTAKHRRWAVGLLIALLCIAAGIPWPGLPYGRPLLRTFG